MSTQLGHIVKVIVHQAEGRIEHCEPKTFQGRSALEYADLWLEVISERAPADGSYYKTDVETHFADGTVAKTRHDVRRGDTDGKVIEHIIRWAETVLGRPDLYPNPTHDEIEFLKCVLMNAKAARENGEHE